MPRRTKGYISRLNNLKKVGRSQNESNNCSPTVAIQVIEELPMLPSLDDSVVSQDQSDNGSVLGLSSDDSENDSPVEVQAESCQRQTFAARLAHAQQEAEETEKELRMNNKRPQIYGGSSERTKQRQRKEKRDMEKKGYQPITNYFKHICADDDGLEREGSGAGDVNEAVNPRPGAMSGMCSAVEIVQCSPLGIIKSESDDGTQLIAGNELEVESASYSGYDRDDARLDMWRDFMKLKEARNKLTVLCKKKDLGTATRLRMVAMTGALNIFLSPELLYTWRKATLLVAKTQGRGAHYARKIRTWIYQFLESELETLPVPRSQMVRCRTLLDEDCSMAIHLHLQDKRKSDYIRAQDIVDFVENSQVIQERFAGQGPKRQTIHLRTAQRWLNENGWRYGKQQNGMYIDGHERPDIVAYRNTFLERWVVYEKRMYHYDNNGEVCHIPDGFPVPPNQRFRLILVTHDESTFYVNDRRHTCWMQESDKATPRKKGEGVSLMVSDFLTVEWGRLVAGNDEARIFFRAGKNRDGYFSSDDLLRQVDHAIEIFEERTKGFATALFLFDNAPSHQKRAPDALTARKMPKGPSKDWSHIPGGPRMRNTVLPNNEIQSLYFEETHPEMPGWFKGMEQIIRERGLWPERGLRAQCNPSCQPGQDCCCCRRLLFTQPDFANQKSHLQEFIESHNHICDFYPKYHCELNFIEQYWGAAKARYRNTPQTSNVDRMEQNMRECLDAIPHPQIIRYANRAARFMHGYRVGLSGAQAMWANKKYHGHRTLPPAIVTAAMSA